MSRIFWVLQRAAPERAGLSKSHSSYDLRDGMLAQPTAPNCMEIWKKVSPKVSRDMQGIIPLFRTGPARRKGQAGHAAGAVSTMVTVIRPFYRTGDFAFDVGLYREMERSAWCVQPRLECRFSSGEVCQRNDGVAFRCPHLSGSQADRVDHDCAPARKVRFLPA